jgi:mRNA-degrading endonuclease RelE of RelBE toxin-antitoxin system
MEFVETPIFTKLVQTTLSADEYRAFQLYLVLWPDRGDVIAGSGGLRKIRWRLAGRGKRGGVRVIYYWKSDTSQIYLLFLYPKSVRSDLSLPELRILRNLVTDG